MSKYHLYLENKAKFEKEINKNYLLKEECSVEEIVNGIVLPPKKVIDNEKNGIYAGGIADNNGEFVAGLIRKAGDKNFNISCYRSYPVNKNTIEKREEEVIFGGILISMFGHTLIEGFTRLWYVLKHPEDKRKIVFVKLNDQGKDYGFLKLLGLENQIEIIEKPTMFQKIIVPSESFQAYTGYRPEWIEIYDKIKQNIEPKKFDKIYLTRTALEKKDCINEEYFEQFYKNLGYEIIAPEQHSLEEQIAYLKGAKEVACTIGTLSHMVLFCENNIQLTILNRTVSDIITPQLIIEQAKNFEVNVIDISMNIFPTTHRYGGIFLFMPNDHWKEYITFNHYEKYDRVPYNKEKLFYDYMVAWGKLYYTKNKYKYIYDCDLYDILVNINKYILHEEQRSRTKLYKNDISKKDLLKKVQPKKKKTVKIMIKQILKKIGLWPIYIKFKNKKIKSK